ncbi:helix-turn-helix domain-containing protein [Saccharopolyspora indica]|uniref:ArsR/SmtB family transcription factor n=1 Tax=Saccharopolyspora indica TaxID=1229659 RepID=UPI0022EA6AB3|nr:metalloregulator ArsR/SmtB family transcription factor [Saccharopolyspora indica]MDA3645814.1 metalloregulator ArsR/SmtB family transcription factor [Saccharopolyspora indica]
MDTLAMLKALANPTRLQILQWLKNPAEHFDETLYLERGLGFHVGVCVADIQARAGLSQSAVSSYLQTLKDSGLLESERVGKWTFYRRNERAVEELAEYVREEL